MQIIQPDVGVYALVDERSEHSTERGSMVPIRAVERGPADDRASRWHWVAAVNSQLWVRAYWPSGAVASMVRGSTLARRVGTWQHG